MIEGSNWAHTLERKTEGEAVANRKSLVLFCLNTTRNYSERIARHLRVPLSPHEERDFGDGEHKARAQVDVRGRNVFVVQSLFGEPGHSVNDKLCRLLFFIGSLKDAGAERVTAVTPYLCYARKDQRTQVRDPLTTRYVAALFEAMGCDGVLTFDVHNLAAFENAFRRTALNLRACPLLARHFSHIATTRPTVVVTPDFGGAKRAEAFRRELGARCGYLPDFILVEKYRREEVISGGALVGEVRGKNAIIVDDLISSGATLSRAALACRDAGALNLYAAATHGLLIGARDLLRNPLFEQIVVTDTVTPWQTGPKLQVIDSTFTAAAAIRLLHAGYTG